MRTFSVRCAAVLMVAALLTGCVDGRSNGALTGPSGPNSTLAKPSVNGPGVNAGPETLPVPVITPNVTVCEQVSITWTNVPTPSGFVAASWHIMLFVWDGDEWIQVTQNQNYVAGSSFQSALEPGLYQFRVKPNAGGGGDTNYNGGFVEVEFTVTACASQGCSPGFWKNLTQHASFWQVYSPNQEFLAVFGRSIEVGAGGQTSIIDPSLVEALQATGNFDGMSRVARIGTAALLSAAHSGVAYPYTTAQVILAVQNALDGVVGPVSIDDLENVWKLNLDPAHCPLGNDSEDQ